MNPGGENVSTFMDTDIRYLKGVGEKRAAQFHKLGIGTVGELLYTFPRYYEDWKHVYAINKAPLGEKTCIRAVVSFKASVYRTPGGTIITKTSATDGESIVLLTFFNNKYVADELEEGEEYLFYGRLGGSAGGYYEMTSPKFVKAEGQDYFHPVYPLTAGLSAKIVAKAVRTALSEAKGQIPEPLSEETVEKYRLPPTSPKTTKRYTPPAAG